MINTEMKNKTVIVTGGAAGIGRATALRFAEAGATVAVWDVDESKADEVIGELTKAGGKAAFHKVDVTDGGSVENAVLKIIKEQGRIDVLVNNAGIVRDGLLIKWKDGKQVGAMSDAQFDAVISVNLRGVFLCTRAVVPHMIEAGGGVVLNASSVIGLYGNFGQTNYIATKAGVIGMTKTWARELGRHGIRVNAVAPGFVATEILSAMPQKVLDGLIARTPVGRIGKPEEIAETYYWLATDAAGFVHGACISVDGGLVMGT
jgi:3-oxoacyl-[acyl-carrier protein] reductase